MTAETEKIDALLGRLLELTDHLRSYAGQGDVDRVCLTIDERQDVIDALRSYTPLPLKDPARKSRVDALLAADREASEQVEKLHCAIGEALRRQSRKTDGIRGYYHSGYDLSSGQLFDSKR